MDQVRAAKILYDQKRMYYERTLKESTESKHL